MIAAYVAGAFFVGLVAGGLLARTKVYVKVAEIEIQGANAREVIVMLRALQDHVTTMTAKAAVR
jgi:hypothetical protein